MSKQSNCTRLFSFIEDEGTTRHSPRDEQQELYQCQLLETSYETLPVVPGFIPLWHQIMYESRSHRCPLLCLFRGGRDDTDVDRLAIWKEVSNETVTA
jgi:hypothetical protein